MQLQIGDAVRVKTTNLSSLGMPDRKVQGGEGVLIAITEDRKGPVYVVKLRRRKETVRSLRRNQIQAHRRKK